MRKSALVAIWVVATIATTAAAYIAVTAAGAEVTDRPLTSVIAAGANTGGTSASTTSRTAAPGTTGPDTATTTAAGQNTTSPTTTNSSSTSSTAPATLPTTSSTASTSTTGTTASEVPWQRTTIPSKGGLVVVSYRPEEVRLESVAPTPGFTYEIDDQGPSEVRVEFEGGDARVEIRVRWDGGLVTEVDEDS